MVESGQRLDDTFIGHILIGLLTSVGERLPQGHRERPHVRLGREFTLESERPHVRLGREFTLQTDARIKQWIGSTHISCMYVAEDSR